MWNAGITRGAADVMYSPNWGINSAWARELGLALVLGEFGDGRREGLGAELDSDLRVGLQVVVPVGVRRSTALGGEDVEIVTLDERHQRDLAEFSGLGTDGVQDDEGVVAELSGLAAGGAELGDDLGVPIVHTPDAIGQNL